MEQLIVAMTEDTENTGAEKLALVAKKLVTIGKNWQKCWEMSGNVKMRQSTRGVGAQGPYAS